MTILRQKEHLFEKGKKVQKDQGSQTKVIGFNFKESETQTPICETVEQEVQTKQSRIEETIQEYQIETLNKNVNRLTQTVAAFVFIIPMMIYFKRYYL